MGVIFIPDVEPERQRPEVSPSDYPVGTVWECPDGTQWVVDWTAARGFAWITNVEIERQSNG